MRGPGILAMMMLMTLVVGAYAITSPRANAREGGSLFSRGMAQKSCSIGTHYSSFYGECTRTLARVTR